MTPDMPAGRWNTPISTLRVIRLDASDATATSTNRMKRLPTVVPSLLFTAATILGGAEVM
jgi:hypothetical protein